MDQKKGGTVGKNEKAMTRNVQEDRKEKTKRVENENRVRERKRESVEEDRQK